MVWQGRVRYLDGFVDGLSSTLRLPFVLLALSGGDAPLTHSNASAHVPYMCLCTCLYTAGIEWRWMYLPHSTHASAYVYAHALYSSLYSCSYVCLHTCLHTYLYMPIHHMSVHVCVAHACTYLYAHVYTHIYAHVRIQARWSG